MNYISLGSSCSIAYQLQLLNLKKESLPFDWVRTPNISFVLQLIQNNFLGFLDDLEHIKDENKFPFIEDYDGINDNFDTIIDKNTKIYKNKYLGFYHDFKDGISLEEIKEKYDRRIKRFYDIIKNKCIFIRDEIKFKESNIKIYNQLNIELKKYNPENQLVIIANTKLTNLIDLDKSIKVFFENEKITEWQHHSILPIIKSLQ